MKIKKVNLTSLAGKQYVYLARKFNNQAALLKSSIRHRVYDGFLFRTKSSKKSVVTDLIPLPVYLLAFNITSRDTDDFINGRAAHVKNIDLANISRDAFYVDGSTEAGVSINDTDAVKSAGIPEAFAFGASMPENTSSAVYCGFTGKLAEGYTTLRSSRGFDQLQERASTQVNAPFVGNDDKFWVEAVVCLGGDTYLRFTFSEAWLAQYAPGHELVSRANRHRITTNFIAACCNGERLALTVPMHDTLPFDPVTNNYDHGACNALTFCIDLQGEGGPVLLWAYLWDRRSENDARIAPYRLWPEAPYDSQDYSLPPASGTNRNSVVDTLEMDDTGTVFGVRMITSSIKLPDFRTNPIDYDTDLQLLPLGGQVTRYVEWGATGDYSDSLIAQGCEAGLFFYQKLQSEAQLPAAIKNTVLAFLEAYGVQNITLVNNANFAIFYLEDSVGTGYDETGKYVFLTGLVTFTDFVNSEGTEQDLTKQKILSSVDSTYYAIIRKESGSFSFVTYEPASTDFESVRSRGPNPSPISFDDDGFGTYLSHMNILTPRSAYIGDSGFAIPATNALITDEISMLLAFMSMTGYYTKAIPGVSNINATIGDESVRTIQEQTLSVEDGSVEVPCVLALTDDSGAYISNDGGDNWIRVLVSERYRDLAYIGSSLLIRPFDKSKEVR